MKITKFLIANPGYMKWGAKRLAVKFKVSELTALEQLKKARTILNMVNNKNLKEKPKKEVQNYARRKERYRPFKGSKDNVLVIGDLHEPFCLDSYLTFCRKQQEIFNCGTIVFIGDIIDNHWSSYHEIEPSALSLESEFLAAKNRIKDWYEVFPNAMVCIGNHDRMVYRKAKTGGIASSWIKDFKDVLEVPGWIFKDEFEINGVIYNHGEGGEAKAKVTQELQSQVQGHLHSKGYCEILAGANKYAFGMQVGCGINRSAYAFAYNQSGKKPVIACGVVLNRGTLPILIPMK